MYVFVPVSAQTVWGEVVWSVHFNPLVRLLELTVGVLLGRWLAAFISPQRLELLAGVLMLILGGLLGFQVLSSFLSSSSLST